MTGDLIVDEGTVAVDNSSALSVGSNTIEVIGGNVTVDRGAVPLFVNTPWIVREKWVGEDELGEDIVREGRVSYAGAWFPRIGPNADILLEGAQAIMEPLSGLNLIEGKLSLIGGNELELAQSLTNEGHLELASAGKLFVDGDMLSSGVLAIGSDSYLDVAGALTSDGGSVDLDGVVQTNSFTLDAGAVLTGSGRYAGTLANNAAVNPGNSPGSLEVLGDYSQSVEASLGIDIAGTLSGVEFDQLSISESATLDGTIDVTLTGGYALEPGQEFVVLAASELQDNGLELGGVSAEFFEMFVNPGASGSVVLTFLGGSFSFPADFNNDGVVDGGDLTTWTASYAAGDGADADSDGDSDGYDFLVWQHQYGSVGAPAEADNAVPEPATALLLLMSLLVWGRPSDRLKPAALP